MAKLLLVEDDAELRGMVEDWLKHEHYSVEIASDGHDAWERLAIYSFDLVILDWQLPGLSGLEVLRQFRQSGGKTPVLMLTGQKTIEQKETGLDSGADDYLTKPFHMKELSARVRALLRRSSAAPSNVLTAGEITLDPTTYTVTRAGQEVYLQKREFALLEFLMRNPNRVFTPDALLDRVWQSETDATEAALRSCMKRLRQKIDVEGEEPLIRTIHGVGYKLQPQ